MPPTRAKATRRPRVARDPRRALPQVGRLVERARSAAGEALPEAALVAAARLEIESLRASLKHRNAAVPSEEALARAVAERARRWLAGTMPRILNATGVPLHTNLGRAPVPPLARRRVANALAGYLALEYDLVRGRRSERGEGVEEILRALTGAEAALVVNNNAAAVLLALSALAEGRPVVVSRGELIEIGGSYRLPEIFEKSGAELVEIGTTNRTHLRDYERALDGGARRSRRDPEKARPALVLRAHPSNYRTIGFTARPDLSLVARLCRERRVPLVEDLGSGCLVDLSAFGLEAEPTVQDSLRAGVDLVTWSGDKLLGGPQAGILLGRKELVEKCRRDPLARALRVDKMTLSALEATLALYFDPERASREVPVLRMLRASSEELERRAHTLAEILRGEPGLTVEVRPTAGEVGGGSLPQASLASWAVVVSSRDVKPEALEQALRLGDPPLVARLLRGRLWLDARTLLDEDDAEIAGAIRAARARADEAPAPA